MGITLPSHETGPPSKNPILQGFPCTRAVASPATLWLRGLEVRDYQAATIDAAEATFIDTRQRDRL